MAMFEFVSEFLRNVLRIIGYVVIAVIILLSAAGFLGGLIHLIVNQEFCWWLPAGGVSLILCAALLRTISEWDCGGEENGNDD